MGFPLLQKTTEMCVDRQIQVLGSYWTGHMSNEETNSRHKSTVHEYHALHKWDSGGTPSQGMELQDVGVDGQDNRETGGSSADRIFFMMDVGMTGDRDMTGDNTSALTDSNFPHIPPRKDVVFNYYALVSVTFKCNIEDETGKVCGAERILLHSKGKDVSSTNLIQHITKTLQSCASLDAVNDVLKNSSPNYVTVNRETHKMHTFTESFKHHVDLLWEHGGGLSWNMVQHNEDFQQYVQGYESRAKFPCQVVQHRLPEVVLELHQIEHKKYITCLDKQFKVKEYMDL